MFDWNNHPLLQTLANEDNTSRSLSVRYKESWLYSGDKYILE